MIIKDIVFIVKSIQKGCGIKNSFLVFLIYLFSLNVYGQTAASDNVEIRQKLLIDFGWKFALGHAYDAKKDFNHGTSHFSYLAKTGYGDGAAAQNFDDRAWRKINLPHDWCVELPFDSNGVSSHGYKAMGKNFPENSVGWYRKTFSIPQADLGKRISIEFDGVHRNSVVWINGFYVGRESSGYASFSYDITDYLNYGGENVIAVRVDATLDEGWYYEGAGIYRHTWLTKTSPIHVLRHGTFVTSDLKENTAVVTVRTSLINESAKNVVFDIEETIVDENGKTIVSGSKKSLTLSASNKKEYFTTYNITNPALWSIENPFLHKLKTVILSEGKIVDTYETSFGIRTIRFDNEKGFFLNGKSIKIVGVCNHQDHAGVGTAIPDALQEFRIKQIKTMGANGIRTSHNPPTPEFLDACDRLGMLVLDENRLMGTNEEHLDLLERFIKRDRNHPSVVLWSLGNEEWHIEGDLRGARIASAMYSFAQKLDSSRAFTTACSGGWDTGIGTVTDVVMGYNYIAHGDVDGHHAKFPTQASIGTEESNTVGTRGTYQTDAEQCHLAPTNLFDAGAEGGWKFYAARPFLSGLFYWTGFDYRGEPTPYVWPAVTSQFGILDMCGYPKDIYYYFKSWWDKEPVLHVASHWNLKGKENQEIDVIVYSNCDQVELFLNKKSLGKQAMPFNSHLLWRVKYQPGILMAQGYKNGKIILTKKIETTGPTSSIQLSADRSTIKADGEDVSIITVQVNDVKSLMSPTAINEVNFKLEGPGKIIGVGNGDPSSHEPDQFLETIKTVKITGLKEIAVNNLDNRPEVAVGYNDSEWKVAFTGQSKDWKVYTDSLIVVRGTFELPEIINELTINLFTKSIVENQSIYVNGHRLRSNIERVDPKQDFILDHSILKAGKNEYAVVGKRFKRQNQWEEPNTDPGLLQLVYPAKEWKRKVFNGLAQIIIQSDKSSGEIILSATSEGLKSNVIKIQSQSSKLTPSVK